MLNDQIQLILSDKHGIGENVQTKSRCHLCGFVLDLRTDQPEYEFPNGNLALFCTPDELNSWKSQYKIN